MKRLLVLVFPILFFYACSGDCVRCQKAGEQTLNYCENDFPSTISYNEQISGLDSLGYTCEKK